MTIDMAFRHFPAFNTSRLSLRQLKPDDAEAFYAMKSDIQVTEQYGQEPHRTLDDTRAWLRRLQTSYEERQSLYWCITFQDSDTVLGSCTFWNFDAGFQCAELGYELHPDYWRQGIMSEALSELIDFGFYELGFNRIEACPFDANTASRRLLQKLGFTYEGNLRQRVHFRGAFLDQLYFGLLREDWLKAKSIVKSDE